MAALRVRVVIPTKEEGVYLMERLCNPSFPERIGMLRCLGGGMETYDATPKDTAKRELKEEVGLDVSDEDLVELGTIPHHKWDFSEVYFLLNNSKLLPGRYKTTAGEDKEIEVAEGRFDDPLYFGPTQVRSLLERGKS